MSDSTADHLLRRVAGRERLRRVAARFRTAFLVTAAAYFSLLLISRLSGLFPDLFPWISLLAIPGIALLVAIFTTRKPDQLQAARLVDHHGRTPRDLYLSFATLASSESDYSPIVVEQAETSAGAVSPSRVVPFHWAKSVAILLVSVGVLAASIGFLPRLDPFGQNEARTRDTEKRERFAETVKATKLRAEQLTENTTEAGDPIDETLADLEKTLQLAKPQMQQANLKKLEAHQQEVGALWRQLSEEKLRTAMDAKPVQQNFGKLDPESAKRIQEQLRKGNLEGIRKKLEGMRKEAAKMGAMPDSAEKRDRQAKLQRELESLTEAMAKAVKSQALKDSLARALEQLDMARDPTLSKEAMEAMQQSLNLTEQELEALAQSMSDLQDLEDALRSLQMAKQLNAQGELDGEGTGQCQGIGDYAALYEQMLGKRGKGPGMKGPGMGEGGVAPEDDSLDSDFKTEKSKGRLAGGKLLLEWQTNEVSRPGEAQVNYNESLQAVKQGVSEAILQEQIPAGYHDGIQQYFDSLQPAVNQ